MFLEYCVEMAHHIAEQLVLAVVVGDHDLVYRCIVRSLPVLKHKHTGTAFHCFWTVGNCLNQRNLTGYI